MKVSKEQFVICNLVLDRQNFSTCYIPFENKACWQAEPFIMDLQSHFTTDDFEQRKENVNEVKNFMIVFIVKVTSKDGKL